MNIAPSPTHHDHTQPIHLQTDLEDDLTTKHGEANENNEEAKQTNVDLPRQTQDDWWSS